MKLKYDELNIFITINMLYSYQMNRLDIYTIYLNTQCFPKERRVLIMVVFCHVTYNMELPCNTNLSYVVSICYIITVIPHIFLSFKHPYLPLHATYLVCVISKLIVVWNHCQWVINCLYLISKGFPGRWQTEQSHSTSLKHTTHIYESFWRGTLSVLRNYDKRHHTYSRQIFLTSQVCLLF